MVQQFVWRFLIPADQLKTFKIYKTEKRRPKTDRYILLYSYPGDGSFCDLRTKARKNKLDDSMSAQADFG